MGLEPTMEEKRGGHLDALESEAIGIFRETLASFERPVILYSIGKDSSVLLHLARKAFYPGRIPLPVLHIDTLWKFREMIAFRDHTAKILKLDLRVFTNMEAASAGVTPFTRSSVEYNAHGPGARKFRCGDRRGTARRGKIPGEGAHLLDSVAKSAVGSQAAAPRAMEPL
jgi:3'-phosphoadenosine 5'-phosphosulfate sulfotransferase (PAPS reductase)/FAD synthetase